MRGGGVIPFRLFPFQADLLATYSSYAEIKKVIILKARQLGVTELTACYVLWRTMTPYITVIIVSENDIAAGEFLTRARTAWNHLPHWLREPLANSRKTSTMEFANGSRIIPFAATPNAATGFTAQVAIIDEWAKQKFHTDIFASVSSIVDSSGGQLIGISTARGVGNTFHEQWVHAVNGTGMHSVFLPWSSRPDRDQAWYEETQRAKPDWQMAQEFPTTADEAFILSGRPRFDMASLNEVAKHCVPPIREIPLGFDEHNRPLGHIRIWEEPQPDHIYVCAADVAEGLPKGDYSAAVLIDWQTGLDVAELHGHWAPDLYGKYLAYLCRQYSAHDMQGRPLDNVLLGVEKNNHGHATLVALLQIERYGTLYAHREWDAISKQATVQAPGWHTNSRTKPLMVDMLAVALREGRSYRNALFVAEARTYCVTDSGGTEASGNTHDDRVVCYAIAEMLRQSYQQPEYGVSGEFQTPPGYLA